MNQHLQIRHGRFRASIFLIVFSFNVPEKTTLRNVFGKIKSKLNMRGFGGIKRIKINQKINMDV